MFAPLVLPPHIQRFIAVPDEPPGALLLSGKILSGVDKSFVNPVNCTLPMGIGVWPSPSKIFAPRPLQLHDFRDRDVLHHSIILQIDGLLFACFRLRLERDVCAQSFGDSFCAAFGPGVSPASTFCGLYMPSVNLLQAVFQSVKAERGYGVFIGPVSCDAPCASILTTVRIYRC